MEFLDSRIWRLGTISGRGFLARRIWKQESIKKRGEVNIRTQEEVGGLGCAIRGDVEAHQKIRSQHQEEEDKESGRTGGKKNIINKTSRRKLKTLADCGAEV